MNEKLNSNEHFGYKVDHTSYIEITREYNNNEEYSGEDTHTSWHISKSLDINNTYPDVSVPFELQAGKEYYMVYVIYNTGDSFSRHDCSHVEFIDVFESYDKANHLVEQIKEHSGREVSNNEYIDEKGNKKHISYSWNGYFESLYLCDIMNVSVPDLTSKDDIIVSKKKKNN